MISVFALLGFTAGQGSVPVHRIELLLPAAVTVGFLPLALLFAFIVRTAAVTERTAATIPFTTPDQER